MSLGGESVKRARADVLEVGLGLVKIPQEMGDLVTHQVAVSSGKHKEQDGTVDDVGKDSDARTLDRKDERTGRRRRGLLGGREESRVVRLDDKTDHEDGS